MKVFKLLLIITVLLNISCKKSFLEVDDNSTMNRQSYVKDLTTMQQFLSGIYIMLGRDFEEGSASLYFDVVADDIKPIISAPRMMSHYTWSQQADGDKQPTLLGASLNMNPVWLTGYRIIRACSFIVEDIGKYRDEDPVKADNMKGQALAIRALIHLKLVNIFAQPYKYTTDASHQGIPLITTSDITKPYSKQTVAEVYNGMIADLLSSIDLMPSSTADTRAINRATSKALLARIYLLKEDFDQAKKMAKEIIAQYPLLSIASGYPNDMFKLKAASQTETLFQLTPSTGSYTTSFASRYFRQFVRFTATLALANILKENPNDIRKTWVTEVSGEWNITKYPLSVAGIHTEAGSDYYQPIIRSSEMYLIAAEAYGKTNNEDSSRFFINEIRKRADPSISALTATGAALMDSIYKERRKEMAFEGIRMLDLQRLKIGVHRGNDALYPSTSKDLPYGSNKAIAPIPIVDVTLASLPQNQGY
jgi:hypothetical protein